MAAVATVATPDGPAVTAKEYAVSSTFAEGLYNSCADVMMPSGNVRALSMMCGVTADRVYFRTLSFSLAYLKLPPFPKISNFQ